MRVAPHDYVNVAFKLVAMILREPLNSKICASDFRAAMECINEACGDASQATKTNIAKSHPQLMRAAIRFLTLKQTAEEHETLIQHLTKCRCLACRMCSTGRPQEEADAEYLQYTICSLGALVMAVLVGMPQTKFRSEKTGKSPNAQP
jgi:hypothetical protein